MALQRSTAVDPRLGALNLDPIMQANAIEQQSLVDLNKSILDSVQNYQTKQEEKKQKEIGIKSIQDLMEITDPKLAAALYNDPVVMDAAKTVANNRLELAKISAKPLSQGDRDRAQLKASYPNLPENYINDIAMKRVTEVLDTNTSPPTFKGYRMSDGNVIDINTYRSPQQPIAQTAQTQQPSQVGVGTVLRDDFVNNIPQPQPTAQPSMPSQSLEATPDSASYYQSPFEGGQGLYGELIRLTKRGDAPTGFETGVASGFGNLFADVTGGDPGMFQSEDQRTYNSEVEANLNLVADALRMNPKYSAKEVNIVLDEAKKIQSGTFKNVFQLKEMMESFNTRFQNELKRINNLLDDPRLSKARFADLQAKRDAQIKAINLLGVETYQRNSIESIDTEDMRNKLNELDF